MIETNDPTAHAEIVAIREATKLLGRFDLSDCILYTNQIVFMSPVKNDRAYFFA